MRVSHEWSWEALQNRSDKPRTYWAGIIFGGIIQDSVRAEGGYTKSEPNELLECLIRSSQSKRQKRSSCRIPALLRSHVRLQATLIPEWFFSPRSRARWHTLPGIGGDDSWRFLQPCRDSSKNNLGNLGRRSITRGSTSNCYFIVLPATKVCFSYLLVIDCSHFGISCTFQIYQPVIAYCFSMPFSKALRKSCWFKNICQSFY